MALAPSNRNAKTVGIAPKVAWPTVALFLIGVVLVILHVVLKESDNTLLTLGLAAIGASGVTGGLGAAAPPALQKAKTNQGVNAP
jgi:hypothetical protein